MDNIHRERIRQHFEPLVNGTNFDALVHSLERMDSENVITESVLKKWGRERTKEGVTQKQLNMSLYSDIQRRGPKAFPLLLECLKDSGHQQLALLLEPSLETEEISLEFESHSVKEFYSDEGSHYIYLDESWEGNECKQDRFALEDLFIKQGFQKAPPLKDWPLEDVGSIIMINFTSRNEETREIDWIVKKFNQAHLQGKPKIVISFIYKSNTKSLVRTESDSAQRTRPFRDLLRISFHLEQSESGVSREVQHLIDACLKDHPKDLRNKIYDLERNFKEQGLQSIVVQNSSFHKLFRLNKNSVL